MAGQFDRQQLLDAGFDNDEIDAHIAEQREKLSKAGFEQREIDDYFGVKPSIFDDIFNQAREILTPKINGDGKTKKTWLQSISEAPRPTETLGTKLINAPKIGEPEEVDFNKLSKDIWAAIDSGFERSITGMLYQGKSPRELEKMNTAQRLLFQAATLTGDLPWMVLGFSIGAAGGGPAAPITGMGGAFALPAGMRKVLMDHYEKGDIVSFQDFWSRMTAASWETLKGYATGMATGKVKTVLPGFEKIPAEVATMVTVGSALDGRVPEPQEFLDAGIIIGGLHAAPAIARKLRLYYADTGKRPHEVVEDIKSDPSIREDLLSDQVEFPKKPIEMTAESLTQEQIEPIVSEITRNWKDIPQIRVVESIKDVPVEILESRQIDMYDLNVNAFHATKEGEEIIYLISDRLKDYAAVRDSLLHETGHSTLRKALGDKYEETMERIRTLNPEAIRAIEEAIPADVQDRFAAPDEGLVIGTQLRAEAAEKAALQARKARTFLQWVKVSGGINRKDPTFAGEIRDIVGRRGMKSFPPGIFKKDALGIDVRTQEAIEAGWLSRGATKQDFMEALERNPEIKAVDRGREPEIDAIWSEEQKRLELMAEEMKDAGLTDKEIAESFSGGAEKFRENLQGKAAAEVAAEDEFARLEREAIQGTIDEVDASFDPAEFELAPEAQRDMFQPFAAEAGFRRKPVSKRELEKPARRSDIVNFLQDKLDVPIRTGRFIGRKSWMGIYKLNEEVIRTRFANDIEVIAHEIGHGLHKFLWPGSYETKGVEDAPFQPFKNELEPIASKPKSGDPVLPEGFAEFIRLYITNAKEAKQKAPDFYEYFEKLLDDQSPESKGILLSAREQFNRWIEQPSYQRILGQISIGDRERRSINFNELYTMTVDDLHPLRQIVREMAGEESLDVVKDPYKLARLYRGVHGKGEHFLEISPFKYGSKENIGKSLRAILEPIKDNLEEFRVYVVAKRALELRKRDIETGISKEDAEAVVKDFEPKFQQTFKDIKEYQEHTLQYLADAGVLSTETLAVMRKANQDYVPFYRVIEGEKPKGFGVGLEARQPIKRIKGSWRDIQDPLESIIKNTYLYINIAEKNAIGRALIDLAEKQDGMGKYIEKIPQPMQKITVKGEELEKFVQELTGEISPELTGEIVEIFRPSAFVPKENVISVWRDGKRELYQVHPEIARTMQGLDRESMNTIIKVLSWPAKWLRAGATLSPEFIARNPIRDMFSAFVYSKYGFVPGWDMARGIFSLVKKDKDYNDWVKSGALRSMLVSMDRKYIQKNLGQLAQKTPVRNLIKNPIEMLRILSEYSEAATRLGEFKRARAKGAGIEEAGFAAREITLDFARMGAKTKAVNALVAFWNANVQGSDKMIRSFKEDPVGTSVRVAAGITLPSIVLTLINRQDKRWKDIPQWQKDLFWIVMTDDHIYRIPKPFELGIIFGTVPERITEFILDKDPKAFDGVLGSLGRGAAPGAMPTFMVPLVENFANRSMFTDRPLIPANREGLLPEYQYKPYTSETAKALSRLIGRLPDMKRRPFIAPVKIENLIRGWSGGLGIHALNISDIALQKAGIVEKRVKPTKTLADIPVIKAFIVRHPSASAESIRKFYDSYFLARQKIETAKTLTRKEYKFEEAAKLLQDQDATLKLDNIYRGLRNAHRTIELIYNNPTFTPDEKRQLIDATYYQMIQMARIGNKIVDIFQE